MEGGTKLSCNKQDTKPKSKYKKIALSVSEEKIHLQKENQNNAP